MAFGKLLTVMPISPRFVVNFTVLLLSVGFLVLFGIIGMTVWLGERAQIYFDEASRRKGRCRGCRTC
jgi:hypothetical protein